MNTAYYEIAGFVLAVEAPTWEDPPFLSPFRCAEADADWHFHVRIGQPIIPEYAVYSERKPHSARYREGGVPCCVFFQEKSDRPLLISREIAPGQFDVCLDEKCLRLWDSNLLLKLLDIPALFLQEEALFLHASFVAYRGKAILFTAPKQTGKSTQAALWRDCLNAEIINGDRALLRQFQTVWHACGSPYCGTSQICGTGNYPIAAIVLLRRGKENRLRKALPREVVAAFLDGCTYDPQRHIEQIMDTALKLQAQIPVYHFSCLPEESAVACLCNALFGE